MSVTHLVADLEFPRLGATNPCVWSETVLFSKIFTKSYMKVKVIIVKCSTGLQILKLCETRRYTNRPLSKSPFLPGLCTGDPAVRCLGAFQELPLGTE